MSTPVHFLQKKKKYNGTNAVNSKQSGSTRGDECTGLTEADVQLEAMVKGEV